MSASEFPIGISAVPASQFGGGQTYLADRRPLVARRDENAEEQRHTSDEEFEEDSDSEEAEDDSNVLYLHLPVLEPQAPPPAFEPTYDLTPGHEHHPHLGQLLDVKL